MNVTLTRPDDTVSQVDLIWQGRIDALACGECSEEDFVAKLSSLQQTGADSARRVVALLDQRYRRGQLPAALFHSIEAKIARQDTLDHGNTIEVDVVHSWLAGSREAAPSGAVDILSVEDPVQMEPATGAAAPADDSVLRDRYVLERCLGSGGMGSVFKAVDRYRCDLPEANRFVAIKFLHVSARPPEAASKLRREFYCAQALSHPNIVKVYELDKDGDVEFFTMEFLDGELLSAVLEKADPVPLSRSRVWAIILEVAAGLAHAHSRNVVHGDLKPQNIMITNTGETRLLDFGASSGENAQKSNSNAMTPAYASCELLAGKGADPRDDLFALACLSYELLAGQHPFQRRRSIVARDLGLSPKRPRGLTRQQWRTLKLGLAWRREDRSTSVADWTAKLRPVSAAAQRQKTWLGITALVAFVAVVTLAAEYSRPLLENKNAAPAVSGAADVPIPSGPAAPDSSGPALQALPVVVAAETRDTAPRPRSAAPASGAVPPVKPRIDGISIAAGSYSIGAHRNFAEIHVRRSNASGGDTTFTWWTEPGTALPDTDFEARAPSIQLLSGQSQMASLFVKLAPNVARKRHAVFYVVIGEPGDGVSLGHVTRAAVVLPAQ
jgi:tRNA A-37 threonylcarbamoyl transferase component Bud32